MNEALTVYLPADRRRALAQGIDLPDQTTGSALFADISGFTPLTEALTRTYGPRRGAEELTRHLNQVYDALIDEVDRLGGSVISFSGDAILCWFDAAAGPAAWRATACALAMQTAIQPFLTVNLPGDAAIQLAMKATVATGPVRRFLVGRPEVQLIDALAGATVARTAEAEHMAQQGEVLVDAATAHTLGHRLQLTGWRAGPEGMAYAVVAGLVELPEEALGREGPLGEISRAQAARWLLPAVYERLAEGQGEFLPELRPGVVLFLRFAGIDYDDDLEAGAKLDAFVRWVQAVVARYDGAVLQLTIGDKGSYIYAVFGAPVAHEDDTRRAASAALELGLPPAALDFIPPPQIGLSQGTMRAGAYGGMTRRTYAVLGDEVNLAARLMQHAAPGEALASHRVYSALTQGFDWEVLAPIQVKGKREPVALARLVGQRQNSGPRLYYTGQLVGRAAEVAQLADFVGPIFEGRFAGLLTIYGEPGMGKSRLVHAARQAIEETHRLRWFTFPVEGILRQSLNPFQYGLREYFDLTGEASEEANKAYFDSTLDSLIADLRELSVAPELAPRVEALAQELDRTRSFLGALAGGLRWEGSLYEQVEPRLRLENTFTACKALLLAESLRRPLVLVLEDGHWLDADSEALLATLTRNIEHFPLAVLMTSRYRDDGTRFQIALDAEVPQAAIDLNQLTAAGVGAMAAQVLGAELDPRLAAFLAEKTNGNPFFVEQLALDLRERGLVTAAGARLTLVDRARVEAEVPDGVNAVLVARLDRLAAQVKAVVQTAAVLGNEFEVSLLSQMLSDDPQLPGKVKRAEAESVWSALTEIRYLFRHSLLRDAAYSMQLQARLRELHGLAGGAIEVVHANELAAQAAGLAYHWGLAGHGPKEARYAALAGAQALRASAFRDAARYFQRALDLLEAGQAAASDASPVELNYLLGEARAGLGQLRPAQECLNLSLTLARAARDPRRIVGALSFLGGLALRLGEVEQAEAYLQEALSLGRASDDQPALAVILSRLGHVARARGANAQAEQFYAEGLAGARAQGDQLTMANVLNALGGAALAQRQFEAARAQYTEAQYVFRALGYRSGVLMTLGNLGLVASGRGDHAEALRLYAEALTLADEIGDRRLRAALLDNLGDVAYDQGDDPQALHYFSESLRLMLEVGALPSALLALAGLAKLRARAGQAAQALQLLGLILHHPACDDETRQRSEPALAHIRTTLPPAEADRWFNIGQSLTLEVVAAQFSDPG